MSIDPLTHKFYLIRDDPVGVHKKKQGMMWDPWPVNDFRKRNDPLFVSAEKILRQRNQQYLDNFIDSISLLPASSDPKSRVQGGSSGMWLYSIRSPSTLPMRVILWRTPAGKIMVRQGTQSVSLERFVSSWANTDREIEGPCKDYTFWKSVKVSDRWVKAFPKDLQQLIHERWWAINGFRFLDLPFELREMIITFAIGPVAVPCKWGNNPTSVYALPRPNMHMAQANKQLQLEIMQALIAHTTFYFVNNTNLRGFSKEFTSLLGRLRFINLGQGCTELLDIFGARMKRARHVFKYELSPNEGRVPFSSIVVDLTSLRRIRINVPHINAKKGPPPRKACQMSYSAALWAVAREHLRGVPLVEFRDAICDGQKQSFLEEHAVDRGGIIPSQEEFEDWKSRVLMQWCVRAFSFCFIA